MTPLGDKGAISTNTTVHTHTAPQPLKKIGIKRQSTSSEQHCGVLHCHQCSGCPKYPGVMVRPKQNNFYMCLGSPCSVRISLQRREMISARMYFCNDSQGSEQGNDPIKAAGSVPAPPLQALTAQSPLVDPCWPHTQAACDAQLLLPLPVPLSSCGRIQLAKQTATREERAKSAEVSPRFTSFPLAEVVCSLYFTSPRRLGKVESCPDCLSTSVQALGTTSTLQV